MKIKFAYGHAGRFAVYPKRKLSAIVKFYITLAFSLIATTIIHAQDPVLPPANLGGANVFDGFAGKPGFVYQGFVQAFNTRAVYNQNGGKTVSDLKINSLVQINQLIYLSPVKIFHGNLAFTVLVPVVQLNSSGTGVHIPTTNPSVFGDPVYGTAIQWSDKKLFGKPFHHRAEFDITIPVGNFSKNYEINPSSHLWVYSFYHAFTLMLNKRASLNARNQFNLNSHILGTDIRPGSFYNGNYSIDYAVLPKLRIEAVAYYLKQVQQDSYAGDHDFYQNNYHLSDTKESVFGVGPGVAYFAPHGILFEAKVVFETQARHRVAGTRSMLRIAIPLTD